jgi:putative GTP pyrophosphokinase
MPPSTPLEEFLLRNRISNEAWCKCALDWPVLEAIGARHAAGLHALESSAQILANALQKFPKVHSVRWRIKDAEHLMEKIVRKRAGSEPKYEHIAPENYSEIVTDLIGLRVLHLFKDDSFDIHQEISKVFELAEDPKLYYRQGDDELLGQRFAAAGFSYQQHPAGYRSAHYVIRTTIIAEKVTAELQVRTLFEEGWSEIDHRIRYPNHTDNELITYFLTLFNRTAGSADEMGSFVKALAADVLEAQAKLEEIRRARDVSIAKAEKALAQLASEKSKRHVNERIDEVKTLLQELNSPAPVAPSASTPARENMLFQSIGSNGAGLTDDSIRKLRKGLAATLAGLNLPATHLDKLAEPLKNANLAAKIADMNKVDAWKNNTPLNKLSAPFVHNDLATKIAEMSDLGKLKIPIEPLNKLAILATKNSLLDQVVRSNDPGGHRALIDRIEQKNRRDGTPGEKGEV